MHNDGDTNAWELLASIYNQLGKIDKVEQACRELVRLQPQSARTHFNLALALQKAGKRREAIASYREVLHLAPNHVETHYNIGLALQELGEPESAISHYRTALQTKPDWPEAKNNLAQAHREIGDLNKAIELLQEAITSSPSHLKLYYTLGETYVEDCQPEKSIQVYHKALGLDPGNARTHARIGAALLSQGKYDEALMQYKKALKFQHDDPDILLGMIEVCDSMGEYEQAYNLLLPLLEKPTANVIAVLRFASLCTQVDRCKEAVVMLENLLEHDNLLPEAMRKIHFALGKLHDSTGNYDEGFKHFRMANNLKHFTYEIQRFSDLTQMLINAYSKETLTKLPRTTNTQEEPQPVFIVGMPRSGTSLVEQIIATHSQVFGAGELGFIPRLVANMAGELGSKEPYPHCVQSLTHKILSVLSKRYMKYIMSLYTGHPRIVTDKMPENFLHLGLIELLFPQSKIVHCIRDPLDTCLSCYFQEFSGTHHYAYDLTSLGAYFYQYRKIMAHWDQVLTLPILEVRYEDMVFNTESTCRAIFDFLGLGWEDQCLLFHQSRRVVNTASKKQVKQPIYTGSIGRWKHYEAHLGPLIAALEKGG